MTDAVLDRGWVICQTGDRREITGAVNKEEARTLAGIILNNNCKRCYETGVAYGLSTLAITQAVARLGGHHTGMDPLQSTHGNAALCLLAEHHLAPYFTLMEGPSQLMAPRLLETNEQFDFAFIDGMHTFQHKLVDYFFADQLLKAGGWLVFHDLVFPSVKKVLRFIETQHNYRLWLTPGLEPSATRKLYYLAGAFLKRRSLWSYWRNGFANLLVLQKLQAKEHPWDYFRGF